MAAMTAPDEDVAVLRELLDQERDAVSSGRTGAIAWRFHTELVRMSETSR
jgi:DNA-binding GntR family transcriptional regulator